MEAFTCKMGVLTAHDTHGVWRDGQHDDLVLATALACRKVTRRRLRFMAH